MTSADTHNVIIDLKQWWRWQIVCVWKGLLASNWPCDSICLQFRAASLSSGFWVGQQTRGIGIVGHAGGLRTSSVKLDPWGLFNAIISCLLARENADSPISAAHGRRVAVDRADLWTALGGAHFVCLLDVRLCLCLQVHTCACIWVIVWSLQSLIP